MLPTCLYSFFFFYFALIMLKQSCGDDSLCIIQKKPKIMLESTGKKSATCKTPQNPF